MKYLMMFCLLLGLQARAVEVKDPTNQLRWLQSNVPATSFKDAFTCNSSFEFSADTTKCDYTCNDGYCSSRCDNVNTPTGRIKSNMYVENCTDESLSIYGDNGWAIEVTRADYERGQNTLLIPLLKNISNFIQPEGDIIINSVMPMGSMNYIHDGLNERVPVVIVEAQVDTGTMQKPSVEIVLSQQHKGLQQVFVIRDGDMDFLRLKGAFDAKF